MCTGPHEHRFLIVKLSAIGDVIHAMPVAVALRKRFPDAFIGWVAEGNAADLLAGHRAINELVPVRRRWLKSPRAVLDLSRRLRCLHIDTTIDLQGLSKSAIAAWLSGARRRIGFAGPMGREISPWLNNSLVRPDAEHVVDRYLQLLRPLGIRAPDVRFDVPKFRDQARTVAVWLAESRIGDRFALINPGAGWPSKVWPAERFAQVASALIESPGVPVVVAWAGPQELAWARTIVAGGGDRAHLAPATTLAELAELSRRASVVVASDTGPLHLAAALGTPCVGLFGPMPATRNGPYGPNHVALQNVCLAGSSRERRGADDASMRAISAAEVCAACRAILAPAECGNQPQAA